MHRWMDGQIDIGRDGYIDISMGEGEEEGERDQRDEREKGRGKQSCLCTVVLDHKNDGAN